MDYFELMVELTGANRKFVQDEQDYLDEQDALPPHKRNGYSEKMAELADMRRKEKRENGL